MEKIAVRENTKGLSLAVSELKKFVPLLCQLGIGFFMGRVALFQFMNPFALAFLSGFIGYNSKIYLIAASLALGIATKFEGLLMLKNLAAIVLICAGHMFWGMAGIKLNGRAVLILSGFGALFSGLLFAFLYDKSLYYIAMALAESVFVITLSIIMRSGNDILSGRLKENIVDTEEIISLVVIMGAVVAGAADIHIGSFSFKYILCTYIVLIGAKRGGSPIGAMCGVVLGFVLTLVGYFNYSLIGVLSVGGVVAGAFRRNGKLAAVAGFLAGTVLSAIYLDMALLNPMFICSSVAGIALFAVTPDNFTVGITTLTVSRAVTESKQTKLLVSQKLSALSNSFRNMGRAFYSLSEKRQALTQKDISRLIDDAAAKACSGCRYNEECWGRNFYKTYQMSFALLEICEQDGNIDPNEVPDEYTRQCAYIGYYSSWLSKLFDMYKLNLNWQNQIAESRDLVSQQLTGIANTIESLSKEIDAKEIIKDEFEEKIILEFMKKNIEVRNVIVIENAYGKYSVTMERRNCGGIKNCFREMAAILSTAVGRKMVSEKKLCRTEGGKHKCELKFIEEAKFKMVSGAAMAKKDNSSASGDCHSVMEIKGGQVILALSDGMGSGKKARAESEAAMNLLEDFLEAGFSKELALRLINSVLVLKSGEESFSTMDICALDLHSGLMEFVKIGAAATFVKRGGAVAQIVSESLPMGILSDVDMEVSRKKAKDGDLIVMVTDGISDCGESSMERNWVVRALEEFDGSNPQDVADYLLNLALSRSGGSVKDDMTVLCARVWEKLK
ncbi:stage II sporulation protein E [Tyzzerella sp. OttesenSCG-928-J15]|nr:stage II sporulation protein E [Tyzzerella sp. OttesenSCG-928-J15]